MRIDPAAEDDDAGDFVMEVVQKTADELTRIKAAVKANFLFQHLNDTQAKQVYDVMKRVAVKKGDVVIRQGDQGDWFYVVDEGEYVVTLEQAGKDVEILRYTTQGGANPCFGELALMYSKPRAATVTAVLDGVLWAMDRRSFRSILMKSSAVSLTRTLRSVEVLKSLSVGQLQRLQDLLTEVMYKDGEHVIRQGEQSENLYIIAEGRVRITRKENDRSEAKLVMELGQGQYFGERALLNNEPRAANVIACSERPLKLLYISKEAFEEVLGPLQEIIDADRQYRESIALKKQLQQESEGLANVCIGDFLLEGKSVTAEPCQYVLARLKGREYTIKSVSKTKVVQMGLQHRIMHEKELASSLLTHSRFVPLALTTLQDEGYLYTVFKTRVAIDLSTLLGEIAFDEKTAIFYTASVAVALEHLQLEANRIVYRNLTPEAIVLDAQGYVQLIDMRYASKADPTPNDFCGFAHYLSPEQVSGQGHGLAVDFWALGTLTYEMITGGANPWLTGDPAKDSEIGIYQRISMHQAGSLTFPDGVDPSQPLRDLLNELTHPAAQRRLGARGTGPKELRHATWFNGFQWEKLEAGKLDAPHRKPATDAITAALKSPSNGKKSAILPDEYKGDTQWYSGFSSFFNTPRQ